MWFPSPIWEQNKNTNNVTKIQNKTSTKNKVNWWKNCWFQIWGWNLHLQEKTATRAKRSHHVLKCLKFHKNFIGCCNGKKTKESKKELFPLSFSFLRKLFVKPWKTRPQSPPLLFFPVRDRIIENTSFKQQNRKALIRKLLSLIYANVMQSWRIGSFFVVVFQKNLKIIPRNSGITFFKF